MSDTAQNLSAMQGRPAAADAASRDAAWWSRGPWLALGIAAAVLLGTSLLLEGYSYRFAWISAMFTLLARSFVEHGIFALGGVPIQNDGVLTVSPDAYLNFPPFYAMVLAQVFRVTGESEAVQHLFVTLLGFATAAVIFLTVRREAGTMPGVIGALAYLAAPIMARYGHISLPLHLAIFCMVSSLACFVRAVDPNAGGRSAAWTVAGAVALAAGVFSSWEAALASPGLLALAVWRRDRRAIRVALVYVAAAGLAGLGVFLLYSLTYPAAIQAMVDRMLLRAGFSLGYTQESDTSLPAHMLPERVLGLGEGFPGILTYVGVVVVRFLWMGPIGLLGLALLLLRPRQAVQQAPRLAYAVWGAGSACLLWILGMSHHVAEHQYQALVIVPFVAFCAGAAAPLLLSAGAGQLRRIALAAVAIGLLAQVAVAGRLLYVNRLGLDQAVGLTQLALAVRDMTEPDAIVAQPERDMVPVYYMRRHVIRSVMTEELLDTYRGSILALCSDCPVYFVLPDSKKADFPALAQRAPDRVIPGHGGLYVLRAKPQ